MSGLMNYVVFLFFSGGQQCQGSLKHCGVPLLLMVYLLMLSHSVLSPIGAMLNPVATKFMLAVLRKHRDNTQWYTGCHVFLEIKLNVPHMLDLRSAIFLALVVLILTF